MPKASNASKAVKEDKVSKKAFIHPDVKQANQTEAYKYRCPLLKEWPVDPVVAPDGKIYERDMLLAEVYKKGGFFGGKLFHLGLLKEYPEHLEVLEKLPKTELKTVWEKNLAAYRKRLGILPPAKKLASKKAGATPKRESSPRYTVYALREEIEAYLDMGSVDEARELFTAKRPEVLVGKENEHILVMLSAQIYKAAKMYDEAIMEYKKIIGRLHWNIYYEIAEIYALQGDYGESVKWHRKGLTVNLLHNKRANCEKLAEAFMLGRGVEKNEGVYLYWTEEAAKRSTKEGEGDPFLRLGDHCLENMELSEAVKHYESASKLRNPDGMSMMSDVKEAMITNKSKRQRNA